MVVTTPTVVTTVLTLVCVVFVTGVTVSFIEIVHTVAFVMLLLAVFTVIEVTASLLFVSNDTGCTSIFSIHSLDVKEVIVRHSPVCLVRV
jgi:hypothetical protein